MRSRSILLVGAIFIVLGVVGAATAASGGARVVGDCAHSQVKPAKIVVYCADANGYFQALRWSSFGGSTAHATGEWTFNNCLPDCAAGHFHSYPVSVTLSKPKHCPDGRDDYQVATASYTSATKRPPGPLGKPGQPGRLLLSCPLT